VVLEFELRALHLLDRYSPALPFDSFFFGGGGGGSRVLTQGFTLAKQVLYCLSHTPSPFFSGYFGDGVSGTICLGWL
jgi:hypothetical protein